MSFSQGCLVAGSRLDGHCRIAIKPMPARPIAGAHSGKFQREDLAIEHGHQPAHRTHEPLRRAAAPIHVLRPINGADDPRQGLSDYFRCRLPFARDVRGQIFALRRLNFLQLRNRHACFLRKCFRCGRWPAIAIRNLGRRPLQHFFFVGLPRAHSRYQQSQPSGGCEDIRRRENLQFRLIQKLCHALTKLIRRRIKHARRNLFASDFQQKVRHCLRRGTASAVPFSSHCNRGFSPWGQRFFRAWLLLRQPRLRYSHRQISNARNHSHPLGH